MKYCPECGTETDSKFCPNCGTPMKDKGRRCPNCGTETNSKFCPECGTPMNGTETPSSGPSYVRSVETSAKSSFGRGQASVRSQASAYSGADPQSHSLGWHKFLIYFNLWAFGVMDILNGLRRILYYGIPDESIPSIALGAAEVLLGVYQFYVRFQLASFKKDAPRMLFIGIGVTVPIDLVIMALSGNVANCIGAGISACWNLAVAFCSWRYYSSRGELFAKRRRCPNCGTESNSKFCPQCGTPMNGTEMPASGPSCGGRGETSSKSSFGSSQESVRSRGRASSGADLKNYNLRWHKILVNFYLWAAALFDIMIFGAINIISAIPSDLLGFHITGIIPSDSSIAGILNAMIGVAHILLGIYLIYVRFQLAKFKRGAPKKLLICLGIITVLNLPNLISLCWNLAIIWCSWRYYSSREELFVH